MRGVLPPTDWKRVMVLARHPDDETLATAGLLQQAVSAGAAVRVLFVTDGDNNPWPQRAVERRWQIGSPARARWGERRRGEALAALACLGVAADSARFLGYPDQGLTSLLLAGEEELLVTLWSGEKRVHSVDQRGTMRNGHIHTGKQNPRCKVCGRAFVLTPENRLITEEQRALIERLLLERISLRGICPAVRVGLRWLLQFMVERFTAAPDHLYVRPTAGPQAVILHRLEARVDELWSFVGKKTNRQWVWIALDATTRQVIAFHVGDRRRQSAEQLRQCIPAGYGY